MSSKAGYLAKVHIGGTPTTLTSEAGSTYSTSPFTYRVAAAAKRVLDPATAVVLRDDSGVVAANHIVSIDRLFGVAVLTSAPNGTLRFGGKYIPTAVLVGA